MSQVSPQTMANAIRALAMDAVQKAKSGHPGMPMGMADIATALWTRHLRFNPQDPKWSGRDRFILSNGHGSMLQYALLHLTGFDLSMDDLKAFRQLGSRTPGHPEVDITPGVETTTGPLGQGIANGVGMALAEKLLAAEFNRDGFPVVDNRTYVFLGDGCLMEGISEEAVSLAGHLGLNKLIVFWDNNNITIDGTVDKANSTDQIKRFQAVGWNTIEIDGHDYAQIERAILQAQKAGQPTLIACKTKIGYGAPTKCGTSKCHGSPLGAEEIAAMRKALNWNYEPFEVPEDILAAWREAGRRSVAAYQAWNKKAVAAGETFLDYINDRLPENWDKALNELKEKSIAEGTKVATRKASQLCLQAIVPHIPQIVGGSADLAASNLTFVEGMKTVVRGDYNGNNVMYGIREHAMGAVMNGMALHGGVIPYGGTFFVFSDYMRPAMRLAALMGVRVIYVLTHDSIGVGEDGPTHQPVEHLASYRCMPNILTFRPCDVVETAEAWQLALEEEHTPSILALTRQNLPMLRESAELNRTARGGYIIRGDRDNRQATLIATGSEVSLAVAARDKLKEEGIEVAVVSMPCTELFDKQPIDYQEEILGTAPRIAVEAASKFGWEKYVGLHGDIIGMDGFGASGPAEQLYEYFGITVDEVVDSVKNLLKK